MRDPGLLLILENPIPNGFYPLAFFLYISEAGGYRQLCITATDFLTCFFGFSLSHVFKSKKHFSETSDEIKDMHIRRTMRCVSVSKTGCNYDGLHTESKSW